ncbi:MAG: hypothetical protein AAGG01_10940 [Planctomycetota bacterium]
MSASPGTSAWVIVSLVAVLGVIVRWAVPKIDLDMKSQRKRLEQYDQDQRDRLKAAEAGEAAAIKRAEQERERRIVAETELAVLKARTNHSPPDSA